MRLRFVSASEEDLREVREALAPCDVEVLPCLAPIDELQLLDMQRQVSDKLLSAFKRIGKPLFVESTGLLIRSLNGFPGGLTQIFLDQLLAERFSELVGRLDDPGAEMKTLIGYCDGRKKYFFESTQPGRIAAQPAGDSELTWERVFIPEGQEQTYAELEADRRLSVRRQALETFAAFLQERQPWKT